MNIFQKIGARHAMMARNW